MAIYNTTIQQSAFGNEMSEIFYSPNKTRLANSSDSTIRGYNLIQCFNSSPEQIDFSTASYQAINQREFHLLVPSFILGCVLLFVGVPGNLLAILVYVSKMKRNTARYFIITLALSDLINCLASLPVELYILTNFWTFDYPVLCKFSRFMTACMNNTSSFLLVMIAIERFRSICTPLKPRFTSNVAKVICVTTVVLAIFSAVPMLFGYGTQTIPIPVANATCYILGKTCLIDDTVLKTSYPKYLNNYFIVGHVIVFLILAVLYVCIARKIIANKRFRESKKKTLLTRKSSNFSSSSFTKSTVLKFSSTERPIGRIPADEKISRDSICSQLNGGSKTTRKHGGQSIRTSRLTCMLFLMTSVFEISFVPYLFLVSIRNANPNLYSTLTVTGKAAYQLFLRSYLINCAINPLIYCFYNKNFRRGVVLLFQDCKRSSGKTM